MKHVIGIALSVITLAVTSHTFAAAYPLPPENEALIGNIKQISATSNDTSVTIAKRYNLGQNAIERANPTLSLTSKLSDGTLVQVPTQHLLPNEARTGIVINLPEMRLYYYPKDSHQVLTYPIGIGKIGKTIPIKKAFVVRKTKDPVWIPPQDIREFNLAKGIILPRIMPANPDNPLGQYAIYTSLPTYLIHSTIFPESIGTRASFGCIRMYEDDIQDFYPSISKGIPITIINKPIKFGWQDDRLYMEAFPALEEHVAAYDASLPGAVAMINDNPKSQEMLIDWQLVAFINQERDGMPHDIGMKLP